MCKRHDNTNRSSEFICLRCLNKNQVGDKMCRPNMREKIKEYIGELDTEIDRLESELEK